jgi:hypothetical protein
MKKAMIPADERPTVEVTLRIPADVMAKLDGLAYAKGMSGHSALIRYYVDKCLRDDHAVTAALETAERLEAALESMNLNPDQMERIRSVVRDGLFGPIPEPPVETFDPDARPIWEAVAEIGAGAEDAWDGVPTDLAANLDHYLYGVAKDRPK